MWAFFSPWRIKRFNLQKKDDVTLFSALNSNPCFLFAGFSVLVEQKPYQYGS
jgi:hypothetical protein